MAAFLVGEIKLYLPYALGESYRELAGRIGFPEKNIGYRVAAAAVWEPCLKNRRKVLIFPVDRQWLAVDQDENNRYSRCVKALEKFTLTARQIKRRA